MLSVNLGFSTLMKREIAQEGLPWDLEGTGNFSSQTQGKSHQNSRDLASCQHYHTSFFFSVFLFLSRPVSYAHRCFHISSSLGMKGTQLDDVKRANAER